jgi:hypothetical protein
MLNQEQKSLINVVLSILLGGINIRPINSFEFSLISLLRM